MLVPTLASLLIDLHSNSLSVECSIYYTLNASNKKKDRYMYTLNINNIIMNRDQTLALALALALVFILALILMKHAL